MKIGIFKGESSNGVLSTLVDEIAIQTTYDDIEIEVIDLMSLHQISIPAFRQKLIDLNLDLIISFNGWGIALKDAGGIYILNQIDVVIVIWLVDDPSFHYDRLAIPLNNKIILSGI